MSTFTVRCVILWKEREDQKLKYLYEERITAWNANSADEAIDSAESEVNEYAGEAGFEVLELFQSYALFDDLTLASEGIEIFSLLRESDLEPNDYLESLFNTGTERQGDYGAARGGS